jgi:ABC-type spermidine/putrescine transport system permease subunit II
MYIFTHVRYGITPAVNAVASLFLLGSFAALSLALACSSILRLPRLLRRGPG